MITFDYQRVASRSTYVVLYAIIFLLTSGVFFIRSDWPLGVNGAFVSLFGVAVLLLWVLFKILRCSHVPRPSLHTKLFIFWVLISCFSAVISFWGSQQLSASLFLVRELIIVLAFFVAGYILVRYYAISPLTVLFVSILWLFVAAFAVLEVYFTSDYIRRIKVLASVNYMASSFAAFFVFCVATIAIGKPARFHRWLLLIGGFLAFSGMIMSGSRSSYLAIALVVTLCMFWSTIAVFRTGRLRLGILKNGSFLFMVAIVGSSLFFLAYDTALQSLFSRIQMASVVESAGQRIFGNYLGALYMFAQSNNLLELFFGMPDAYSLYPGSYNPQHPHNLFISSLLFTGVWSFVSLALFLFTLSLGCLKIISGKYFITDKHTIVILSLSLFVLFFYTMFSGHFTRNWHFFFVCGLLSAYIEVAKVRIKVFRGIDVSTG